MTYPAIPFKRALTVGLALFGFAIAPAAFAQTVPQGTLQQPLSYPPVYVPPGGAMDIITDTPPNIGISPGHVPPGPRPYSQTIVMQHHGPIVPEGPLIEWEDDTQQRVMGDDLNMTSAVRGDELNGTYLSQSGVVVDQTGTPVYEYQTVDTTVVTPGSQTVVVDDQVVVRDRNRDEFITNWWWDDDNWEDVEVDYTTGSVITGAAVRGGTTAVAPNVSCPGVTTVDDRDGLMGWMFDDDEEVGVYTTGDEVIYTEAVRGTSGSCGSVVPPASGIMFNQGVRGTDVEVVPEGYYLDEGGYYVDEDGYYLDEGVRLEGEVRGVDEVDIYTDDGLIDTDLDVETDGDSLDVDTDVDADW